jgi:hypothetical protein
MLERQTAISKNMNGPATAPISIGFSWDFMTPIMAHVEVLRDGLTSKCRKALSHFRYHGFIGNERVKPANPILFHGSS